MKYIRLLAVLMLCFLLFAIPVMALTSVTDMTGNATVEADGSCKVSMTIWLELDKSGDVRAFPLPAEAMDVQLNGQAVKTWTEKDKLQMELPVLPAGQHTLQLEYRMPCLLSREKEQLILSLPLLCGFPLPIEHLEFTLTLPGEITGKPVFISGYYQENIRLDTTISGNTLQASLQASLKDHETLALRLPVNEAHFSLDDGRRSWLSPWDGGMLALMVLAMLYFCLGLMPKVPRQSRSYTPPEGISAGELGSCLTGCGTDLTMMVLTWAQLGYILVEKTRNGGVRLHKRMEMGNERSYHEARIFQILFGKRVVVDGTGPRFVRLRRKVAIKTPLRKQLYTARSGNTTIFRGLCCAAGFCCGVQMVSGGFFMLLMGVLAVGLSLLLQESAKCIPLRNKWPLVWGACCGVVWIITGALTHSLARVIPMVLFQLLAGVLAACGGKRSDLGQRVLAQIWGLRRHMAGTSAFDMQQLQQRNENYFHDLAPYALALGLHWKFARRFDNREPLPDGGWLKDAPPMTAMEWTSQLRQVADAMNKARTQARS